MFPQFQKHYLLLNLNWLVVFFCPFMQLLKPGSETTMVLTNSVVYENIYKEFCHILPKES